MKVVFVSKECPPSTRSSGIGAYVWETGRALAQRGHEITIVAAADDTQATSVALMPNLTVIRLVDDEIDVGSRNIVARTLWGPVAQGMAYRDRVADCLVSLAEQGRADIVEFPGFRGESFRWLERPARLPMVVRMHGFTAGLDTGWKKRLSASGRCLNRWELREVGAADLITAVSEDQAKSVRARFGGDRLRVVHNSIDTGSWRQLAGPAQEELRTEDILFAGGLTAKKGIFVLLQAAERLRASGWKGRLVVAGRAYRDFERYLHRLRARSRSLPSWVDILGPCPRERLAGFYRDAGVCCFPSLQDPFPYTCMEAMTCGGLVAGSAGTGMAEMLNTESGFLTRPGDAAGLAETLHRALSMPQDEREAMREAARERAKECFDHAVIVPRLLQIYAEAMERFHARSR